MKKFTSGKISIAALAFSLLVVGSFFLGKTITKIYAGCSGGCDGWVNVGSCVANSCGTREGKQKQEKTTTTRVCETGCPSVTFTTGRCDPDYHYDSRDSKCHKHDHPSKDPIETFSVTFTYNKPVGDEKHCHKPTPESLSVPAWARGDYGSLNNELDLRDDINCHDETSTETRQVDCVATVIECPSTCGNYEVETGEQCDDGNIMSGDGCSSTCQSEISSCPEVYIGDGYCDEVCNNAENNWDGGDCEVVGPVCGNEIVERGEDCDDGNTTNGDGCSSDCTNESEEPTPTPNPDLCLNIDGIQYTVPEGLHINATGVECVAFGTPGVDNSTTTTATGEVLGISTEGVGEGEVLGISTMAGTGSFDEIAYQAIMVIGGTLSAFGIKNFKKASKKA